MKASVSSGGGGGGGAGELSDESGGPREDTVADGVYFARLVAVVAGRWGGLVDFNRNRVASA